MEDATHMQELTTENPTSWHPAFRPSAAEDLVDHTVTREENVHFASLEEATTAPETESVQESKEESRMAEAPSVQSEFPLSPPEIADPTSQPAQSENNIPLEPLENFTVQDTQASVWNLCDEPKSLNYTNSFPPVPPLSEYAPHSAEASNDTPLANSQAETIIEEDKRIWDDISFSETQQRQDSWAGLGNGETGNNDFFVIQQELGSSGPVEPSDEEARFEEGLPLVADQSLPQEKKDITETPQAIPKDPLSPKFGDTEADDFFRDRSDFGETYEHGPEFPPIDRKSTEQVLSEHVHLEEMLSPTAAVPEAMKKSLPETSPEMVPETGLEQSRPETLSQTKSSDLALMTGGGIAVSTTTVASQVLADTLALNENPDAQTKAAVKEEDLTALWAAALGDEDLLPEDTALDPSAFFDDDGEGFLEDEVPTPVRNTAGQLQGFDRLSRPTTGQQLSNTQSVQTSSRYAPISSSSTPTQRLPDRPASNAWPVPNYGQHQVPQQAKVADAAGAPQSFADKAKGGYSSPFDAPMDISRPKRRQSRQVQQQAEISSIPPPRSNSITSPSSLTGQAVPTANSSPKTPSSAAKVSSASTSAFFEELPMATRSRPPTASNRAAAPVPGMVSPPPQTQPISPPVAQPLLRSTTSATMQNVTTKSNFGLVAPERKMTFTNIPQQTQQTLQPAEPSKTAPPPNTRYSPAPAASQMTSQGPNRYAVPPNGAPPRVPSVSSALPFLPRTSSPLAAFQPQSAQPQDTPGLAPPKPQTSSAASSYQPSTGSGPGPAAQGFDASSIERPNVTQRGPIQDRRTQAVGGQKVGLRNEPPQDANFLPPSDGSTLDPLKRWQGAPILRFGFGGSVVTSFPKRVPRFVAGQTIPSIICVPGEVSLHTSKLVPLDTLITSFPGPLKNKGKKRDVLQWLDRSVQQLEIDLAQGNVPVAFLRIPRRFEERIMLWKLMRVLVEFDGSFETNPAAIIAVRDILYPELKPAQPGASMYGGSFQPSGIIARSSSPQRPTGGAEVVEQIRKLLLSGEREKAVWQAVDQRLWGHAMLIASTLSKEIWKQVAQEFVKTDVKTVGENAEPLSALYDTFAGNSEESIDQLVPSSARAGLQMVSTTTNNAPAKDAFEGLNHWRETLTLILSNRSAADVQSLTALGQLLATYGRIEAAHICYVFARSPGLMSGADDPHAAIVLLGEDHRANPGGYAQNLSSVLLTEVYEFATCVLATPASPSMGYLQAFKLWHATMLAESGSSEQAHEYCNAVSTALKGSTKASPYYHQQLFAATEDLNNRLAAAPRDGTGSWMSRPSMDKVSGSMWSRFSSFVAGDDSDAASQASKSDVDGPFARISGDTPTISRGPSPGVDQYAQVPSANGYISTAIPTIAASSNSRYAPKNASIGRATGLVKKQPSYASISSVSSGLGQAPRSYQSPPTSATLISPGITSPPAGAGGRYSPAISQTNSSPEATFQQSPERLLPHRQVLADQALSPSLEPSAASQQSANATAASEPDSLQNQYPPPHVRAASPYEPRPTPTSQASSNYAPRAQASPMGRSPQAAEMLQPSPLLNETRLSPQNEPSLIPQLAVEDESNISAPLDGYIDKEPSNPFINPQNAGYQPAPSSEERLRAVGESPAYEPPSTSYDSFGSPEAQTSSYEPTAAYEPPTSSYEPPASGYEPPAPFYHPSTSGYEPHTSGNEPSSGYEPPSSSYDPPSISYEPSSAGMQSQPSYEPNGDAGTGVAKKKSMMDLSDEEDDLVARAAALKIGNKSDADRAADEAFRKAAEADAERDKGQNSKGKSAGWLGGWFSRAKAEEGINDKKPIKARLGEDSSFYYDANLKKWVNKNASPDEQASTAAATPPPPKGVAPPGRIGSPAMGPPSMTGTGPTSHPTPPPSLMGIAAGTPGAPPAGTLRSASPRGADLLGMPPQQGPGAASAGALVPGIAPPSRPGTGMSGLSNASSIDDLMGPPQARKGGTLRGNKKKGRYVDVMAK